MSFFQEKDRKDGKFGTDLYESIINPIGLLEMANVFQLLKCHIKTLTYPVIYVQGN